MKQGRIAFVMGIGLLAVWAMLAAASGEAAGAPRRPAVAGAVITSTVALAPSRDNTIYQGQDKVSNGAGQHFFAGNTNNDLARRGLLAFDLSGIPADATIITATLTLNMSKTISGESAVSLHAALADWGEGESDAIGEEGAGALATPGDATWVHTFHDDQFWAAPGGDFAAAASATTMVGTSGSYAWASPGLLADVAGWVADPATNFGWLVLGDEAATGTAKRFDSRENPDEAVRPVLVVVVAAEAVEAPPVYVPVVIAE